jgi:copper chaperone CopZ
VKPDAEDRSDVTTSTTYQVTGMTCEHCTRAVAEEIGNLAGVTGVTIDLVPGGTSAVTVDSAAALADEDVIAALDEAGDYRLAGEDAEDPEHPDGPMAAPAGRSLPLL